MVRGDRPLAVVADDELAAVLRDLEVLADQRLRGRRAEADDHLRLHHRDLPLHPRPAGRDLPRRRLLVDPPAAAGLELEVLHGVRDVGLRAVDADLFEDFVEQLPGGADERLAGLVLAVARLLADEDDAGVPRAFPEDRLRRVLVEVAALAELGGRGQLLQFVAGRDEVRGRDLRALGGLDHGVHSFGGVPQQAGDQFRLRQRRPVLDRHLRPHGVQLDPRGVEDVRVVGLPEPLQLVAGRRLAAGDPRTIGDRFKVPRRGLPRRQDRPPHVAEPPREEVPDQRQDRVVRPVPGDEVLLPLRPGRLAEADERLGLVAVPPHLLLHPPQQHHVRVRRVAHQRPLPAGDPPEDRVEPVEAGRLAVAGDLGGDLHERLGDRQRPRRGGRQVLAGQQQVVAGDERDVLRRDVGGDGGTGGVPPLGERRDSRRVLHKRL